MEETERYWIKKLFVDEGARLSLQSHKNRDEILVVLSGKIVVLKGDTRHILNKGEFLKINKKEKHRIEGIKKACVLEAAFGKVEERDIIRYQDDYGRVK